jgi:hypothetical protein
VVARSFTPQPEDEEEDEEQTPCSPDSESVNRFLQSEVLPWYEKRRRGLELRPLIRGQAFGETVDPVRLDQLARYEVHILQKLASFRTAQKLVKPA